MCLLELCRVQLAELPGGLLPGDKDMYIVCMCCVRACMAESSRYEQSGDHVLKFGSNVGRSRGGLWFWAL